MAGAILAIDYDGEMRLHGGLIRKADREAAIAAGVIAPARGGAGEDAEPASRPSRPGSPPIWKRWRARPASMRCWQSPICCSICSRSSFPAGWAIARSLPCAMAMWRTRQAPPPALPRCADRGARHAPADPWTADRARAFRAFRKTGKARVRGDLAQYLAQLLDLPDSALGR
ncbi:MAG: hypothetical protein JKP98_03730 [Rhodobacteraceae bacterium]|nr:hypothetical protein [Paracoccaceae bacterium]